jgi:hypothetical protein
MAKYNKYGFDEEDDSMDDSSSGYGSSYSYGSSYGKSYGSSYSYGSYQRKSSIWDRDDYSSSSSSSSSYWMKGSLFGKKYGEYAKGTQTHDYFLLAQYLRAVSNFVYILTGRKDIEVTYNSQGKNATNGKQVFLSASINEEDFDSNVGLALHEASHILYTDFDYVQQNLWNKFDTYLKDKVVDEKGKPFANSKTKLTKVANKRGIKDPEGYFHIVLNIVEDLYIDAMTYAEAEGYRGYYKALYQKFFGDIKIVKGFYDQRLMEKNSENYLFHLCNMRNPNRNLNALSGLDKIWNMLDLQNIRRLQQQTDRIDLASEIFSVILQNLEEVDVCDECGQPTQQGQQGASAQGQGQGQGAQGQGAQGQEQDQSGQQGASAQQGQQGQGSCTCSTCGKEKGDGQGDGKGTFGRGILSGINLGGNPNGAGGMPDGKIELNDKTSNDQSGMGNVDIDNLDELTDAEIDALKKIFQKQIDSIIDNLKKDEVSQETLENIQAVNELDVEEKHTAKELAHNTSSEVKGIKTYVVKSIKPSFLDSNLASCFGLSKSGKSNSIEEGIRLGKILANKIQIRNDKKTMKQTRLKSGRIDKRLIHELGSDNFKIFSKVNVTEYNPSYIHISIDQSGSMSGSNFNEAMKFASILASASKYIKNLRVVVSTRTCINGGGRSMNGLPFIMTIFDSKVNDMMHIRKVFPCVRATSSTPEGITFEAIMSEIIRDSKNSDAFFINICDGQPGYSYHSQDMSIDYGGTKAQAHSRKQIDKMLASGIRAMTYFIGSSSEFRQVVQTYVKNCFHVSSSSDIPKIARMLNKELLHGSKTTK